MKASDLIAQLEELIRQHGDLDIKVGDLDAGRVRFVPTTQPLNPPRLTR